MSSGSNDFYSAPNTVISNLNDLITSPSVIDFYDEDESSDQKIKYNPDLLRYLKIEHQAMIANLGELVKATEEEDYEQTNQLLTLFSRNTVRHLKAETRDLFLYLEGNAKRIAMDDRKVLQKFKRELSNIANALKSFINNYSRSHVCQENSAQFLKEVNGISIALIGHIEREERRLYPLYLKYKPE